MAQRRQPLSHWLRHQGPKSLVAVLILALLLSPMAALLWHYPLDGQSLHWPYVGRVLRFTLLQAGLSTLLSALAGLLLARTLARRHFWGRSLLLAWLDACFVMPSLVVVLAIVISFSPSGSLGQWFGPSWSVYGLSGILLAHVFFETPLFARVFLQRLEQMPKGYLQQAQQLGFNDWQMWRWLDWPALRTVLPSVSLMVFLICLTSFTVVVSLGGGPRATTLEVAIYQALRFEWDIGQAVKLALLQFALAAGLSLWVLRSLLLPWPTGEGRLAMARPEARHWPSLVLDTWVFIGLGLLWIWPVLALVINSRWSLLLPLLSQSRFWQASINSLLLGSGSALLAVSLALLSLQGRARMALVLAYLVLLMPAVVLATGSFLLVWQLYPTDGQRLLLLVLINALLVFPFAIKLLRPAKLAVSQRYDQQMQMLGMGPWQRWRWVYWPLMQKPLATALGFCFMLAIADLAATLILATPQLHTLGLLLYRLLASHQLGAAIWVAFALVLLGLLVQWALQGWARWYAKG